MSSWLILANLGISKLMFDGYDSIERFKFGLFVDNQEPIYTTMLSSCAKRHVVLYSTSFKLANLQCQNIVSFRVSLNPEVNAFGNFNFCCS